MFLKNGREEDMDQATLMEQVAATSSWQLSSILIVQVSFAPGGMLPWPQPFFSLSFLKLYADYSPSILHFGRFNVVRKDGNEHRTLYQRVIGG
jgi:hypothetical protein